MDKMHKIEQLVNRLHAACQRLPDLGGDLWARGMEAIQSKYEVEIWMSKFEPSGVVEAESLEVVIDVVPVDATEVDQFYDRFQRRRAQDGEEWPEYTGPGR